MVCRLDFNEFYLGKEQERQHGSGSEDFSGDDDDDDYDEEQHSGDDPYGGEQHHPQRMM